MKKILWNSLKLNYFTGAEVLLLDILVSQRMLFQLLVEIIYNSFSCWTIFLGLIYEDGLCVNPTECPCDYHGSFYKMGSVVHEECNNWLVPSLFLQHTWFS